MNFWIRISDIDRRWIYLLMAIAIILPFFVNITIPIRISPPTQDLYTYIDTLSPDSGPILISFDYDPSTQGELTPMAIALLRHAFSKNLHVITMSLYPTGIGIAENITSDIAKEYNKIEGRDYVVMPYAPGYSAVILSIGEDIKNTFATDYYGNRTDTLSCLRGVKNFEQIPISISISGSSTPYAWITYGYTKYGEKIGVGTTAVSATSYYPYLRTKQVAGMLGGLKGAAEYETLIRKFYHTKGRSMATIGMNSQSMAHIIMIILIILGNISYFAIRKQNKRSA